MRSEVTLVKAGYLSTLRREWLLGVAFATTALFLLFGKGWLADLSNPLWFALMLVWLFAVILSSAFAVVHHAESLAVRLGEPLGTLVLTLSVIGIEVMMISAVMLTGEGEPELARDTMFGVVMIVLNGMIGLSLLLGGYATTSRSATCRGRFLFCPDRALDGAWLDTAELHQRFFGSYAVRASIHLSRRYVGRDL